MKKINIRRLWYKFKHEYLTLNNIVVAIALMIAAGWAWGSLTVMQRNYRLQKELDDKARQLIVAQLDMENAKLEQRYYKTNEYKELAVRKNLGLVSSGEAVLILPPNSLEAKNADANLQKSASGSSYEEAGNFKKWLDFLFGARIGSSKN